jgi:hypothetical protein
MSRPQDVVHVRTSRVGPPPTQHRLPEKASTIAKMTQHRRDQAPRHYFFTNGAEIQRRWAERLAERRAAEWRRYWEAFRVGRRVWGFGDEFRAQREAFGVPEGTLTQTAANVWTVEQPSVPEGNYHRLVVDEETGATTVSCSPRMFRYLAALHWILPTIITLLELSRNREVRRLVYWAVQGRNNSSCKS